ncbi:SDR family NAD(P)-dependent oxidoreductase [Sphingomonas agri]|uniref:SDR family NAD(P)-dependent oxidoreductase n=1 Tax=Sphingomonas agri TaxID=1813878 RepID=UPI00311F1EFE
MENKPLHDWPILITGASSGIGAHFARVCARAGSHVIVAARRRDRLADIVNEIRAAGQQASAVELDVADEESVSRGFERAEAEAGPIRAVIANAGISGAGLATKLSAGDFDQTMAVNVRGVFLTAREAARRMMAADSRDNRILLISSIGGLLPLPALSAYSASKAAVVMLGQSLAREWINKGINVNVLCPGYMRTEINDHWFESDKGKAQIAGFHRQRLMPVEALDSIMLYLCGPQSAFVTGSVFKIDDGQSLP